MAFQTKVQKRDLESKNVIINGGLDFWQRGTNVNSLDAYGPDRFLGNAFSSFFSREDGSSATALPNKFKYAVNAEQGAGGGAFVQRIESIFMREIAVGSKVVFSVYAASATVNATGIMLGMNTPDVEDDFSTKTNIPLNTGGGTDYDAGIYLGDLEDRTVEFKRFNYVFTMTEDMRRGLEIFTVGDLRVNGTKGWLSHTTVITGVMLHEGVEAIPFKRHSEDYDKELISCQRYYIPLAGFAGGTSYNNAGTINGIATFSMRTVPVIVGDFYISLFNIGAYTRSANAVINHGGGSSLEFYYYVTVNEFVHLLAPASISCNLDAEL